MRAIITYHSIDDTGSVISTPAARFAAHVAWLASGAVDVVSVRGLLSRSGGGPAVAITFDDGFDNFATHAWPLLREHRIPVTLFVPTHYVGRQNTWDTMPGGTMTPLRLLDWETLGRLASEGVTLGGHTRSHADLRRLRGEALRDEVAGSMEDIRRETGHEPDGFAYPYGYHDDESVAAARAACGWAVTTRLRSLGDNEDAHLLPRLDAYFLRGPARPAAFGSAPFRAWIGARAFVRRVRGRE